jgi:hypothetical protein
MLKNTDATLDLLSSQAKLHAQAILTNLLMQSMSANVENLDGAANNPIDFFL